MVRPMPLYIAPSLPAWLATAERVENWRFATKFHRRALVGVPDLRAAAPDFTEAAADRDVGKVLAPPVRTLARRARR